MDTELTQPTPEARKGGLDWATLRQNPDFWTVVALIGALFFAFWPFLASLPKEWFAEDTYYAHGAIVPLCALFIVYDRWDRIKGVPVKGFWPALVLLLPVLYLAFIAQRTIMGTVLSMAFMAAVLLTVLFVAGWRWLWALAPATLYLVFGLPVWQSFIDRMTIPLQGTSSTMAYGLLKLAGMDPYRPETNLIILPNFTLEVAVACSGLKLALAVIAISVFFVLVARLRWWGNLILIGGALPLSVVINGIRVGLIGIVGNEYGAQAGIKFHDTSGYIALVLCFIVLYKVTKWLGWK